MEEIEHFGDMTLLDSGIGNDERPVATRGEPSARSLKIAVDKSTDPEYIANMRWPSAIREKTVYEHRFKMPINWGDLPKRLDKLHKRFAQREFRTYSKLFLDIEKQSGNKRMVLDDMVVVPVAINEWFAVILSMRAPPAGTPIDTKTYQPNSGHLWYFPTAQFEAANSKWQNTGIVVKDCQCAYLLGARLYLVDDTTVRAFDLAARKELFALNTWTEHQILLSRSASSLRVSLYGFIIVCSQQRGFLVLLYNQSQDRLELLHYENPHIRPEADPRRELSYTACSIDLEMFAMGTSNGQVEFWTIEPVANPETANTAGVIPPKRYAVLLVNTMEYFRDEISTHSQTPIRMVPGEPVTTLLYRGRRLLVASRNNRVIMDASPGHGKLLIPKAETVASVAMFGDLLALLYYNGGIDIAHFNQSRPYYTCVIGLAGLSAGDIPFGQQLIATLPDCVVALMPGGKLLALNQNRIVK